jgi:hypothetical protein
MPRPTAHDVQLRTLYAEGYSQRDIALILGMPRRTLRDCLKALGLTRHPPHGTPSLPTSPPPRPLTETELAHLRDMFREILRAVADSELVLPPTGSAHRDNARW